MAAGWALHDKCLLCLHNIVQADKTASGAAAAFEVVDHATVGTATEPTDKNEVMQRKPVEATEEQISRAPVGNLYHRGWGCESEPLGGGRRKWAPEEDIAVVKTCDVQGNPAWERALLPKPPRPLMQRAAEASFRWILEPEGGIISGDVYPDGSALDGPAAELI